MKNRWYMWLWSLLLTLPALGQEKFPFENEIKTFQHQDSLSFPKPDGILFIGSSSIRRWEDLEQRFSRYPVIKRGVGGSELSQWVKYFTPYVLFPYHPSKIFIYAGENDIAAGKSAQTVTQDFITLWTMIHEQLPKAEIYFMSIKQSPSRAGTYNVVKQADKQIADFIAGKPHMHYIDVNTILFNTQTHEPDSTLFQLDLLHLKSTGYDRWEKVLKPYVK
ncbi:hypothetical protein HH214_17065 [Mucilaginibacter robiniae]|uniref:SGNH hydrolase-type esterase domain-containing protein n=1 Tax=Mucilaginibacter robiniae TaxID=2728022 RepID=A0A7L5E369_9SPHI|nr:GDSL-type esterase/lipase family protein [Mucilaginibacter robiniae]QJD97461.1 hypothetical protein HH214_17065 [Mucilaginibacter robiniae]